MQLLRQSAWYCADAHLRKTSPAPGQRVGTVVASFQCLTRLWQARPGGALAMADRRNAPPVNSRGRIFAGSPGPNSVDARIAKPAQAAYTHTKRVMHPSMPPYRSGAAPQGAAPVILGPRRWSWETPPGGVLLCSAQKSRSTVLAGRLRASPRQHQASRARIS